MDGGLGELVLLRDIEFRSICEHHLLPFTGVAHLAYIPHERVVGLGRLPRVVDTLAARPQLQEHLTEQIADALQDGLDPLGVLVVLDATHACVTTRGTRQSHSSTVTMASRGSLIRTRCAQWGSSITRRDTFGTCSEVSGMRANHDTLDRQLGAHR